MKIDRKKADRKCGSIAADKGSENNIQNEPLTVDDTCNRMEDGEGNAVSVSGFGLQKFICEFWKEYNGFCCWAVEESYSRIGGVKAELTELKT